MAEFEESDYYSSLPAGEGVVVLAADGTIMAANLPAEKILQTRLEPGQSLKRERLFTPEYQAQAELVFREALQSGGSRSFLTAEIRSGGPGETRTVEYSVFPLREPRGGIIGILLNFREHSFGREGSAFSRGIGEAEYQTLFENLAEGVFTVNFHMRITSFNRRAHELTGFKPPDVLGRFCWEIFQSDLCQGGCPLRVSMETEKPGIDQDVRIINKDGHPLSILVNTSVIKDSRGKVVGAVETLRPLNSSGLRKTEDQAGTSEDAIIGQTPYITSILDSLPDIAESETSVVIEGESGTGKELIAKAIHRLSRRADGPFVGVNTSALAETLLESELFGHEKGAFTGAASSKAGRFELARGGTLFLDEIAEIKPSIQVKLLRVLEERQFERVGGARPITMDCRIICATNRTLTEEVRAGRFRTDLFYRLRTVPLTLPPLRDRIDDLPLLVDHFIHKMNAKYGKRVRGIDPKVLSWFRRYNWPGNIRELQRTLEYAFVFIKGPIITAKVLPPREEMAELTPTPAPPVSPSWEEERNTIQKALDKAGGRRQEAAKMLGLSRSSLWRKMKEYGL
ncbi:MAG: sigma 54-interacting transcriptional regulator [Pseudomonadota bacterium]